MTPTEIASWNRPLLSLTHTMPPREIIPAALRKRWRAHRICRLVHRLEDGRDTTLQMHWNNQPFLEWLPGVDPDAANRHLQIVLRSPHAVQERIPAAAYLVSLWTRYAEGVDYE